MLSTMTLIIGHRGSPRRAIENTLESFELAMAEGAHGIETDLRCLDDGSIVLFHDALVGDDRVESLDAAGLRSRLGRDPAPLAVLERLPPGALRILEVKSRGWEPRLIEAVGTWDDIIISSFDHRVLARCRELGWTGRLGAVLDGALVDSHRYLAELGIEVFFPHGRFVDAKLVALHADAGIDVIPWTVNSVVQARELISWGCAGIITDDPALMSAPEGPGLRR